MILPLIQTLLCLAILVLVLVRRAAPGPGVRFPAGPRLVSAAESSVRHEGATLTAQVTVVENHTLAEFIAWLNRRRRLAPALDGLLDMYDVERRFPDMGDFRLGPNLFDRIPLDWIIFTRHNPETSSQELVGHGVTTRLNWDRNPATVPDGWQGSVRRSYVNAHVDGAPRNTLVGLFIRVEESSRQHGWAGNLIGEMKRLAHRRGMEALIIPLRPPLRYEKEYAALPLTEFAALRRPDGQPLDHWIRIHVRLGAKVIGLCETSHQHALPLKDFRQLVSQDPIARSGYLLVRQKDGGWYNVYVDLEREFALINQGCVWVEHPLT